LVGLVNYPILTKTNYNQWALLLKTKLDAHGLWSAIDPGDAEFRVDRMALDTICNTVPVEMLSTITTKDTAVEAWESIKTMCIGNECIRKAIT
jgi:hypothetical protein